MNFATHEAGAKHQGNVQLKKATPITSFFQRTGPSIIPSMLAHPSLSAVAAPPVLSMEPSIPLRCQSLTPESVDDEGSLDVVLVSTARSAHCLLKSLVMYSTNLPQSIPLGVPSDLIAGFSQAPASHLVQGKEAFHQVASQTYREAFGNDRTPIEIASMIRRGRYGMDGFCSWTAACLNDMLIPSELMVPTLELVISALQHLYVFDALLITQINCGD